MTDRTLMGLVSDARGWRELLAVEDAEAGLLRGVRAGRPAGERGFVERLSKLTGRELAPKSPGPKPRVRGG